MVQVVTAQAVTVQVVTAQVVTATVVSVIQRVPAFSALVQPKKVNAAKTRLTTQTVGATYINKVLLT